VIDFEEATAVLVYPFEITVSDGFAPFKNTTRSLLLLNFFWVSLYPGVINKRSPFVLGDSMENVPSAADSVCISVPLILIKTSFKGSPSWLETLPFITAWAYARLLRAINPAILRIIAKWVFFIMFYFNAYRS